MSQAPCSGICQLLHTAGCQSSNKFVCRKANCDIVVSCYALAQIDAVTIPYPAPETRPSQGSWCLQHKQPYATKPVFVLLWTGIPHIVLDQADGPTQHPQAHFINNRTMEVRVVTSSRNSCVCETGHLFATCCV